MYHSIKSIKELQSLDRKQQQKIISISGTRLMPHIRDLVANGISEDDLATLAKIRKRPMGKFALITGLVAGILFALAMQFAMGGNFS